MSDILAGACTKCGAPYWLPEVWMGVVPPPPTPTCMCWNMPTVVTSSSTINIDGKPVSSASQLDERYESGRKLGREEGRKIGIFEAYEKVKALTTKLNTDYRYEILDAIRALEMPK